MTTYIIPKKGQKRAEYELARREMGDVWTIYQTCVQPDVTTEEGQLRAAAKAGDEVAKLALRDLAEERGEDPDAVIDPSRREEQTLTDIVNRLVKWGSVSERSLEYAATLAKKIRERPQEAAQKAARLAKW